ncbi:Uncharacterised protein [Escherichia coli]|uniref:Uncharacterized protein n=1 Tax=Escherichia coli TaxID=562 RepID=A0A376L768_ECOLX|nr:Uncharacterised protein [Escherichia coli]
MYETLRWHPSPARQRQVFDAGVAILESLYKTQLYRFSKSGNEHLWYVSNVNFFHGILLKTKEVGVLEWFLLAALVVSGLVYEYRMHSLTKKIGILENEYCALKSSLEREQGT